MRLASGKECQPGYSRTENNKTAPGIIATKDHNA